VVHNDTVVGTGVDLDAPRERDCCEGNGLFGTLPTNLLFLTSTRLLDLGSNDLTGTIPTEIGWLTNLTKLSLATNKGFTGVLPIDVDDVEKWLLSRHEIRRQLNGHALVNLCLGQYVGGLP
jgi:hypothetical protein